MPEVRNRLTRGFTLVELLVVMVIIGTLMSLILVAAMDGVRRAEERGTQALLIKLDTGLSDRVEALLTNRTSPTTAHVTMAQVVRGPGVVIEGRQRAQVIATYDMMRAELPDVFYIPNVPSSDTDPLPNYPLNFAGQSYPTAGSSADVNYVLPLGATSPGTGIYGASYSAAAGIYKNLGYIPAGYDGVDNNGIGGIDEAAEGAPDAATVQLVNKRLRAHTHKTARSEMLYALLVEGQGPLGSAFSADEFSDREVRDTDGDGLPEFIDAWGEPLQFYRWPVLYHSDLQKGLFSTGTDSTGRPLGPYLGALDTREQDPLDANQQLVAPDWWSFDSNKASGGSDPVSGSARYFLQYFNISLVEPLSSGVTDPTPSYWDRGASYPERRAFFSRFLIISSGPDREPGIGQAGRNYANDFGVTSLTAPYNNATVLNVNNLMLEGQAAQATPYRTDALHVKPVDWGTSTPDVGHRALTRMLFEYGLDDVTNHNLLGSGGGIQL